MEKVTLLDGREQYLGVYRDIPVAITQTNNEQGYSSWKLGDNEALIGYETLDAALENVKLEIDAEYNSILG